MHQYKQVARSNQLPERCLLAPDEFPDLRTRSVPWNTLTIAKSTELTLNMSIELTLK